MILPRTFCRYGTNGISEKLMFDHHSQANAFGLHQMMLHQNLNLARRWPTRSDQRRQRRLSIQVRSFALPTGKRSNLPSNAGPVLCPGEKMRWSLLGSDRASIQIPSVVHGIKLNREIRTWINGGCTGTSMHAIATANQNT